MKELPVWPVWVEQGPLTALKVLYAVSFKYFLDRVNLKMSELIITAMVFLVLQSGNMKSNTQDLFDMDAHQ